VDKVFTRRGEERVRRAAKRLSGLGFDARIEELTRILDEDGYWAQCRREADGSWLVVEHNCAILDVADVTAPLAPVSWPSCAGRCLTRASTASNTRWRATSFVLTASQPEPASLAGTHRQLLDRAEEHVLVGLGLFDRTARHVSFPAAWEAPDAEPRHEVRLVLICVGANMCGREHMRVVDVPKLGHFR
jgi:hypothetical protein